ncbi:MAG: hypothetical protein KDJ99_06315, partial [Candidatus Competibacteraceae bacterium]|nr:hypothetical protein [Candidatus Competibacteraceae bacterium]
MSKKKSVTNPPANTPSQQENATFNRREFLQASVSATALGGTALGTAALAGLPGLANAESEIAMLSESSTPTTKTDLIAGQDPTDSSFPIDTWAEPWVWRPSMWPNQQLHLNLVENGAPFAVTGAGFENLRPLLFSYNGITPGPTIRMNGDETLSVELRNLLGRN